MKSKPNHNAEYLEKYLTENLSDEQMHELEAESLDDAFLADALDGLAMLDADARQEDLGNLTTKINEKITIKKTRKTRTISMQKQRLVAGFVLLISCSAIFVLYKINLFDSGLAESATQSFDEKSGVEKTIQNQGAISEADEHLFKKKLEENIEEETVESPTELPENSELKNREQPIFSPTITVQKSEITQIRKRTESDKLKAFARLQKADIETNDFENEKSNEDFVYSDVEIEEEITEAIVEENIMEETVTKNTALDPKIMKDKAEQNFGAGQSLEFDDEVLTRKAKAENKIENLKNISFEKYLSDNLVYPEEAQKNTISGIVKIEFTIKRNGKISNPKIIQKLGYGCDKEALRLIENYPFWEADSEDSKKSKTQKTVEISFPLK